MARQTAAKDGGKPWCLQIEAVEGCSMSKGKGPGGLCHFCGLAAIRSGPGGYKFLTVELADLIGEQAADFCPNARVEFALRGEPTMNPKFLEIIKIVRAHLPATQLMVTTNGDTLREPSGKYSGKMAKRVDSIFEAGIDFIVLDTYYPKERRDDLRRQSFALSAQMDVTVVDFYDDWLPIGKSPYSNHGRKVQRTVILLDDLAARDGEQSSRQVKTHAGANPMGIATDLHGNPAGFPKPWSCARPFREMTIAWNGDFTLCCDDWRKEYVVGNVQEQSLRSLWSDERLEAARARLYHKDRSWGPCALCDAPPAPRFGLLPVCAMPTRDERELTEEVYTPRVPLWKEEG